MAGAVRVFKWFRAAQEAQQEAWLRQMAQRGLHLHSVNVLSFWQFTQGDAADVVYRLDCGENVDDPAAYWGPFERAGWECVANAGGWKYFRQAAVDGSVPAFPPDQYSKRDRLRSMLFVLVLVGAGLGLSAWFMIDWPALRALSDQALELALLFGAVATALCAYGAYRFAMRVRQLR